MRAAILVCLLIALGAAQLSTYTSTTTVVISYPLSTLRISESEVKFLSEITAYDNRLVRAKYSDSVGDSISFVTQNNFTILQPASTAPSTLPAVFVATNLRLYNAGLFDCTVPAMVFIDPLDASYTFYYTRPDTSTCSLLPASQKRLSLVEWTIAAGIDGGLGGLSDGCVLDEVSLTFACATELNRLLFNLSAMEGRLDFIIMPDGTPWTLVFADPCNYYVDAWMRHPEEADCELIDLNWCGFTSEDVRYFYTVVRDGKLSANVGKDEIVHRGGVEIPTTKLIDGYLTARVSIESLINNAACNGIEIPTDLQTRVNELQVAMTDAYCPENKPKFGELRSAFAVPFAFIENQTCTIDVSAQMLASLEAFFEENSDLLAAGSDDDDVEAQALTSGETTVAVFLGVFGGFVLLALAAFIIYSIVHSKKEDTSGGRVRRGGRGRRY